MSKDLEKVMKNYQGVVIGKQVTDFVLGASSPQPYKVLLESGDWSNYQPEHEFQNKGVETYACTVFSATNAIETLFMYYLHNNLVPNEYVTWLTANGYFKNGFINFSDRFPAQYAGITLGVGTYQYKANEAVRTRLIPEDMFPYTNVNYYDNTQITEEMLLQAEEFNKRFTVNWQWVEESKEALKMSPLQGVVRYSDGEGVLCPSYPPQHCIEVLKETDIYKIKDTYTVDNKEYCLEGVSGFVGYSLTINSNSMDTEKFIKDNDLKWVRNTNTGAFGRIMQNKLRTFNTTDRAVLCLLDNEVRNNGVQITNAEWIQLPSEEF